MSAERDKQAEQWLLACHSRDWYIGAATDAEWRAAYQAVDDEVASIDGSMP